MKNSTIILNNHETRVKSYLYRIKRMKEKIDYEERKLQRLRELTTNTSSNINPIKVYCTREDNAKAIIVEDIIDIENEFDEMVKTYSLVLGELEIKISSIADNNCRKILFYRYIRNYTFDEIIYEMKLSRASVYRLHAKGIGLIEI